MSGSAIVFTPTNLMLSPSRITFNGVDLGGTQDGVSFKMDTKTKDLMIDQLGDTPVDSRVIGQSGTLEFILSEVKNKANWKVAFPFATLLTSGGNSAILVNSQIGYSLLGAAKAMVLHPLENDDATLKDDYTFFKVASLAATEIKLNSKDQVGMKITMRVFPDTSVSPLPARYFFVGDPAIGAVNASAAAAVAGSNTGTGTIGSLTATASAPYTETVTVTCIGINGANHSAWKVEGASSGHLGTVVLTGGAGGTGVYTGPIVNFTITETSTDFIVGDSFTIAVTGANWA